MDFLRPCSVGRSSGRPMFFAICGAGALPRHSRACRLMGTWRTRRDVRSLAMRNTFRMPRMRGGATIEKEITLKPGDHILLAAWMRTTGNAQWLFITVETRPRADADNTRDGNAIFVCFNSSACLHRRMAEDVNFHVDVAVSIPSRAEDYKLSFDAVLSIEITGDLDEGLIVLSEADGERLNKIATDFLHDIAAVIFEVR